MCRSQMKAMRHALVLLATADLLQHESASALHLFYSVFETEPIERQTQRRTPSCVQQIIDSLTPPANGGHLALSDEGRVLRYQRRQRLVFAPHIIFRQKDLPPRRIRVCVPPPVSLDAANTCSFNNDKVNCTAAKLFRCCARYRRTRLVGIGEHRE